MPTTVEYGQQTSAYARPRTPRARLLVQWAWFIGDLGCIAGAAGAAAWLINRELGLQPWAIIALMATVQLLVFYRRGGYRAVVRYTSIDVLATMTMGVVASIIVAVVVAYFLSLPNTAGLGREFLVVYGFVTISLCGGARLATRLLIEHKGMTDCKRALIYGSGSLGEMVLRELRSRRDYHPVGFLDDNASRHGTVIRGCRILGGFDELPEVHSREHLDLLVIANRDFPQTRLRAVFQTCMDYGIQVKVVRGMAIDRPAEVHIQDLALEDLLRRPSRRRELPAVHGMLRDKTVLVTGAGGSIGSELCQQIARAGAKEIVALDHSEFNLYQIDHELRTRFPTLDMTPVLATLADRGTLDVLIRNHRPDIVFHAAAYKHVPMVEDNPFLGMANNLGGFSNLLDVCVRHRVPHVVAISTDKAVRPTNVMGASKRACEVLMQNLDAQGTRLCAVRFGNVLGSSGSVIPHFLDQIRRGGPVTITHPEVSRYFMLLPEAVELVLQAGAIAQHGDIFILDMGAPVKIVNLARQLIFMTGHIPEGDIKIVYTGLRPGEKLTEELLLNESERSTVVDGITVASPTRRDHQEIAALVDALLSACSKRDLAGFVHYTHKLVPEWQPSEEFKSFMEGTTDTFRIARPER